MKKKIERIEEERGVHSSLRKKYIGNAAFYKMALAVAIPIMIQNGITNFVSLLDNIMSAASARSR